MKKASFLIMIICFSFVLGSCVIKKNEEINENSQIQEETKDDTNASKTISADEAVKISSEYKKIADDYLIQKLTKYDRDGNIILIKNYEYDEQYRLKSETNKYRGKISNPEDEIMLYEYDYDGKLKKIHLVSDINATRTGDWVEYSYNSSGGYTATTYSDGKLDMKTVYNKNGLDVEQLLYTEDGAFKYTYTYNVCGDMKSKSSVKVKTDGTIEHNWGTINYTYDYNKYGLKERQTTPNNGGYTIYKYDENYCLTKIESYGPNITKNKEIELDGWTEYEYIHKRVVLSKTDTNGVDKNYSDETSKITLKNYTRYIANEAENDAKSLGLDVELIEEFSNTIPTGAIIRHEPAAGTVIEKGNKVIFYVSKGSNKNETTQQTKKSNILTLYGPKDKDSATIQVTVDGNTVYSSTLVKGTTDTLKIEGYGNTAEVEIFYDGVSKQKSTIRLH